MNATTQSTEKAKVMVPASEEAAVVRTLLAKLNTCPSLPAGGVRYERLLEGTPNMSLHVEQGAYKARQYILGGYQALLRFGLYYRVQPGDSTDQRLSADEGLNTVGEWLCDRANLPELGEGCKAVKIEAAARAAITAAYDDGDEDHAIILTLTYEVAPQHT